jgi:hypothetical protein
MHSTSGQAMTEYVIALTVFLLFLSAFIAPFSPLNLYNLFKKYQNGIVNTINKPVP